MVKQKVQSSEEAIAHKAELINSSPTTGNRKESILRRIMIWIALEAGVLLIGAGMIYFWLYQPAIQELRYSRQDLEMANRELATSRSELQSVKSELEAEKEFSATLQEQLGQKEQVIAQKQQNELVLKALAEANIAQNAFANQDLTTVRIALANVKRYIDQLQAGTFDPAILEGIKQRSVQAQDAVDNQAEVAGSELASLVLNLNQLLNLISSNP